MMNFMLKLRSIARKDEGQDILEYALLVALIAIGAVVAITAAGTSVQSAFNNIASTIAAAV
jgi:pilus assembly protein Flp/PilA